MEDHIIINKINAGFAESCGTVTIVPDRKVVHCGTFLRARLKNSSIIIFDFTDMSVGMFIPLSLIVIVKRETDDGFEGGDLCFDLFIDGDTIWDIIGKILNVTTP